MRMAIFGTTSPTAVSRTSATFSSQVMARLIAILMPVLLMTSPLQASAQSGTGEYPNKPIRIVVTFPPGGSSDAVVRLLIPRLNEKLGQQVVVDNRPGAGGNIGLAVVAKSPPDGYTVGVGAAGGLAANVSLYPQMPFDPVRDFKPVTMLADIPFVLVANPSFPARSLSELIRQAKASPGKISMGHGGNGTAMHLSSQLFKQMAGIHLVDIAYRGSGPASVDTMAGQIPLSMVDLTSALQQIKAGKLIALAVTSAKRLPMLPDVPTMSEAGLPGYESTGWFGVVAPAGTPAAIVSRLNTEIVAALNDPDIRNTMRGLGVEPAPGTVEGFEQYIKTEIAKWARVIKNSGTRLE